MSSRPTGTAGSSDRLGRGLAALTAVALVTHVLHVQTTPIVWLDRDMSRAQRFLSEWITTGAEMNYGSGGSVPGGGFYALLALPASLGAGASGVFRFLTALDAAAAVALGLAVARRGGLVAGVLTTLAWYAPTEARNAVPFLWNPAVVPAAAAAMLLLLDRATRDGRRAAWAGAGLAAGLGAHAHTSVVPWAFAVLALLVVLRWRRGDTDLTGPAWVLAGWAATYVPHALDEALHGFPNTRALLDQSVVSNPNVHDPLPIKAATLLVFLAPISSPLVLLPWLGLLGVGIQGLSRGRDPRDEVWRAAVGASALAVLLPAALAGVNVERRYVLVATPVVAWLVGLGAARVEASVVSSRWHLPWRTTAALLVVALAPLDVQLPGFTEPSPMTWDGRMALLDGLRERHGGSLAQVVGRTAFLESKDGAWAVLEPGPVDHVLAARGEAPPGSLAPPCYAILRHRPGDGEPPTGASLPSALGLAALATREERILSLEGAEELVSLVVYDPSEGLCPMTQANRYLLTPVERDVLRPLWDTLEAGRVLDVPASQGIRRAARVEPPGPPGDMLFMVDLLPSAGTLDVTLHAPQLRGESWTNGWHEQFVATNVEIVLASATGEVRHALHRTTLGWLVVSPITRRGLPVPPGTWAVDLELDVAPPRGGEPGHVRIRLVDALTVPEG